MRFNTGRALRPITWAIAGLLAAIIGCAQEVTPTPAEFYRFDDNFGKASSVSAPMPAPVTDDRTFTFGSGEPLRWTAGDASSTLETAGDALVFTTRGPDTVTSLDGLAIDGHATDAIILEVTVSGTDKVILSWRPRGADWTEIHRVFRIYVTQPDAPVTYTIQTSGLRAWRHREIDQIRFGTEGPGRIEIRSIRMRNRKTVFSQQAAGTRECSIGDRVRPCLFAHCPAAIEYRVRVPNRAYVSAGLGIVEPGLPVDFSLEVRRDGAVRKAFSRQVTDPGDWEDIDVDLSEFAGTEADVILRADCAQPGQIALWSSPVLIETRDPAVKAGRQPLNVVLYVIDALRADHLDAYGYPRQTAPHVTAFAKQGVRFARCFSQDTWTKPSMTSQASGVDSLVHGVERYGDVLPDPIVMLPELLRAAGYATCAITENPHTPPDANPRRAYCYLETPYLLVELSKHPLKWRDLPAITYEAASDFLERNRDRNFFLYVHTMECHDIPVPHPPDRLVYDPPEPFRSLWAAPDNPAPMDLYDGGIAYGDHNFQRVLEKIAELGLAGNTLVIFAADHGEGFGEHEGKFGHAGKPYNDLIHIPLILSLPGCLPAGKVVEENVEFIDLGPTILDFLGLSPNPQFQGKSLRALIAGANTAEFTDRTVYASWVDVRSVIRGPWKLINDGYTGQKMLFNLAQDYAETYDTAQENPQVFKALDEELAAHVTAQAGVRARLVPVQAPAARTINPNTEEALKALGYIEKTPRAKVPAPAAPKGRDPTAPAVRKRPTEVKDLSDCNVLIIVIDALRADHLGCYGYRRNTSPFIDSIAVQGTLFERAVSNCSYTCESIATVFTGLLPSPGRTGRGWFAIPNPDTANLADLFARAGYATGLFTNTPALADPAFDKGFDEVDHTETEWGKCGAGMKLTRRVLEFAKGHQAEKTMVYVHYLDPHAPYEPPQDKYLRFADHVYPHPLNLGDQVRPCIPELVAGGFGPGEERFEDLMLRYDGEIADTDEAVQQLLEGLKALALLDDTLVILTADHGEEFLDHGYVEHAWRLYEESVHVPLLFWSPRFFKPARIPDRVSLADLLPTLLELARVSHQRNDFSGTAFFRGDGGPPVFTAPGKPIIAELLIETRSIVRTVTDGDFKYVAAQRWLTPAECSEAAKVQSEKVAELRSGKAPAFDDWGPVVFEELFNLKEDPFEQHPILEGHADQRAALQKILTDYRAACLAPAPSGKTPEAPRPGLKSGSTSLTPDQETQMKALGYF